ncbi:MAG: LD-carboxypeptidase [Candidatus Acidiferrum sp.]
MIGGSGGMAISATAAVPRKPQALGLESVFAAFAPASPSDPARIAAGVAEFERLGFRLQPPRELTSEGYFASPGPQRLDDFRAGLGDDRAEGLVAVRGGYGSNYLLDSLFVSVAQKPKAILGFSDLTSLQIFLWQRCGWVTFYGPMLAAGFDAGAGKPKGYDKNSLLAAFQQTEGTWEMDLQGEPLKAGKAEGRLLGGCMTLIETTLGTPWELDTDESILVLEDRGMKPWQVDRALMHLKQAGKFERVRGIVLGDFPECEPPVAGSPTVRDVCARILISLGVPIIFGAAVGHTTRPMLTLPLGVMAQMSAAGTLTILEPAVIKCGTTNK